ncbi:GNAT family N-acetyltransferase, partial [Methylobacterium sp. J-072]|uniref:GNAT family N-acetyltransferase n=1 Tax=Methylobacterium sp. J-072 TaxID=2836651 RepID=UPI001FB9ABA3
RPDEVAFLRAVLADLGAEGRVRVARLRRDGRILASAILPLTGPEAWAPAMLVDQRQDPERASAVGSCLDEV